MTCPFRSSSCSREGYCAACHDAHLEWAAQTIARHLLGDQPRPAPGRSVADARRASGAVHDDGAPRLSALRHDLMWGGR